MHFCNKSIEEKMDRISKRIKNHLCETHLNIIPYLCINKISYRQKINVLQPQPGNLTTEFYEKFNKNKNDNIPQS